MLSYHKECLLYGSVIEDCRLGELRLMVYGFGRVGLILASIRALLCRRRLSTLRVETPHQQGSSPTAASDDTKLFSRTARRPSEQAALGRFGSRR